jgi:hypothetical protein
MRHRVVPGGGVTGGDKGRGTACVLSIATEDALRLTWCWIQNGCACIPALEDKSSFRVDPACCCPAVAEAYVIA